MSRGLAFIYRLAAGALLGGQLFFAFVVAPAAFTLPERRLAADLVGLQLAALDRLALGLTAVAVLAAVLRGANVARRALPPLLAGLCAAASMLLVTPWVRELREAGQTGTPIFARLHAASTLLLAVEMVLLGAALWFARDDAA